MSIESIRQTISQGFNKPDPIKVKSFKDALKDSKEAQLYLKDRGLSEDTIAHFNLGYDKERDAIAIPIHKNGEVVNIKYRLLNPEGPKYTQEKGCEVWLFNEDGLVEGKKKKGIAITEGEFDCMMLWQNGVPNVISPASGKDSYGVWIERLDDIQKVYVIMDNDEGGRQTAKELAERIGVEKSFDIVYPDGIKDTNEYFLTYTSSDWKELAKKARPFHTYSFQGLSDIIESLKGHKKDSIELDIMPQIRMENDWMVVVSGRTNTGKTSYCLNIADELVSKGIPTLVLPFERGIKTVGKRFLEMRAGLSFNDTDFYSEDDWNKLIEDVIDLPLYFAMPEEEEIEDTIRRAKRLFGVRVVIADQPDYVIGHGSYNKNDTIEEAIKEWKNLCIDSEVIFIISHHIRKQTPSTKPTQPQLEDLQGTSSIYKVPEAVLMLHTESPGQLEVVIAKNKGPDGTNLFDFNTSTGRITRSKVDIDYENLTRKN